MNVNVGRILAVMLKELREYRRSPFIIGTMAVLPLIFLIEPIVIIFRLGASVPAGVADKSVDATFLLMLITPVLIPAVLAAYSVVGEREQGTLEPLLTTPVRREELLLGKALGVVLPGGGDRIRGVCDHRGQRPSLRRKRGGRCGTRARSAHPCRDPVRAIARGVVDLGWPRHLGARQRGAGRAAVEHAGEPSRPGGRRARVVQRLHAELHRIARVRAWPARRRHRHVANRVGPLRSRAADHGRSRSGIAGRPRPRRLTWHGPEDTACGSLRRPTRHLSSLSTKPSTD